MAEKQPDQQTLSRGLKDRHVQLIALGGAIGTGLFLGSGKSIHVAGPSILLAYLITGIMCFLLMRALGELLLADLHYNSFVDAIRDYLGSRAAFITGWTYWLCWVAIAMAEITAIGMYVQLWLPNCPQWVPGLIMCQLDYGWCIWRGRILVCTDQDFCDPAADCNRDRDDAGALQESQRHRYLTKQPDIIWRIFRNRPGWLFEVFPNGHLLICRN